MASCVVRDWQGKEAGKATLDLKVAKEASAVDLMHRAVLRQQAHMRQGTASTLTRSEVRGGGRKPYKQKGTGRARQGSVRTPLRPGGGIIFGPKPRSYNLAMNRKERRSALRTALMARIDDITVVKDFGTSLEAPKTREITEALGRLGIAADTKVLIVLTNPSEMVRRSVRNLDKVKLISANHLNVFDLLHANSLVVGEDALTTIQEVYGDD
ncbi:MAG: 50S ribosomal protein L4 [Parasynechococcus sp.]|jgi:large subunit ribosomal protein L4|uniref:Large ribosomal subunit protein uL4 n=1 Tax=Synechococcus sp. (strain CC9902) TaxID=316279 RepID=RL4_SYNS9|nr:50S ribosomal protein L4 [Synechococcus sp. CC9902]Q3AUW2.1 RecName: Full=Large ribosomal subunit protein uL4; AltName: Full=50S ribosomal protein L4 [Synechococcus sp. CC9902]MBL6792579.1 50S ribosomal protein L4 [Synechococcus sp. BS307-5m-G35]MDA7435331.1 50S ribosomal protein L4 [Synechococcus sp. AH-601-J22]MDG2192674.1 50S ribosomal protein L4 [Synechococcus sp. cluster2_bin.209]RCL58134.1 MAG: 50S ribosomal protein L4 [Synechococcus sp. MED-G69]ABB26914.1 LSU ribosomal protein L4P [|tara:strand:+ start:816 stop:1451 length:636 start_codon:yes stop_codon:yes gene_type:complete